MICRHREREQLPDGRVLCPECAKTWETPETGADLVRAITLLEGVGYIVKAA